MEIIGKATIKEIVSTEDGYEVRLNDGKTYRLSKKSLWSWGRMQHGRTKFDNLVQDHFQDKVKRLGVDFETLPRGEQDRIKREASGQAFEDVASLVKKQRPFQAIIDPNRRLLFSVASLEHMLMKPDIVMKIGMKVFSSLGIDFYERHNHIKTTEQLLGLYDEENGMNLGMSFNAGNIFTQHAISISQMIELQVCTNPLIWMRSMLTTFVGHGASLGWKMRILRFKPTLVNEKVLEQRITQAVKDVQSGKKGMLVTVRASKTKLVDYNMARTILEAFASSYSIGSKIQSEVMSEFTESNGKSLYDLAQATSHVAWSSEKFYKLAGTRARGTLTGIAAVMTTIRDPQQMYQFCKKRLAARMK